MRLMSLMPRWIHPHVFTFLCPHCRQVLLSCKDAVMTRNDQWTLFDQTYGDDALHLIVGTVESCAWKLSSPDFSLMTVMPSLDASKSGHWHGFINQGQIA